MPAAKHEVEAAQREGVDIRGSQIPLEVIKDETGRATAMRLAKVEWTDGKMKQIEGSEFEVPCDLVVSAIGQTGDLQGMEELDNGKGLIDADKYYQVPDKPGYFVIGDIIWPHLLTTAIGHASIAAESIDHYLNGEELGRRPKVEGHHFNLLNKLREWDMSPEEFPHVEMWGTNDSKFAVHNYEDRSKHEIIPSDELFLAHFPFVARNLRTESHITADEVLGHFEERFSGMTEEMAQKEAERCMSCGMCFECDNCVIYCPQDAVLKTPKARSTMGRYVYTDYDRCIGCHICAEVCPSGYIDMAMGD